jgi:hypothetical protein
MRPGHVGAAFLLPIGLLLFALHDAHADAPVATVLDIPRVAGPPDVAGLLAGTSTGWKSITDFRQRDPGDGEPGSQATRAWVGYDDENLYVVFDCKDDPSQVRARLTPREDIADDDQVLVLLDTYADHQRAYEFACNPLGVQLDGILANGQDDDFTFDALWHSDGKLTPTGYVVRITIPFRSLRFSNTRSQTWRVGLGRLIQRNNEEDYWPYITKRLNGLVPQLGAAQGLEGISPGRNVQLIPYGMSTRARFLDMGTNLPRWEDDREFRGGLDGKLVFHDAYTLDAALNPDFSQVESDEPQVTINQRFEVFFPERRPFFIENAGFFVTPTNLLFSRRIADPQYGIRLTGKAGPWVIGGLAADDRAPGGLVPVSDPLHGERAIAGALSLRREFGEQSSVGLLATNWDFGPSFNRVISLDTRLKLTPNWVFSGQAMRTLTRPLDGERLDATGYVAELVRDGRHFTDITRYTDLGPDFHSELGFVEQVDLRQLDQEMKYRWRPAHKSLVKFGPNLAGVYTTDSQGLLQDWKAKGGLEFEFTGNTELQLTRSQSFERIDDLEFRRYATELRLSSQWFKRLTFEAEYDRGTDINRHPAEGLDPFLANHQEASLTMSFRPTSRLVFDQALIYSGLAERAGASRAPGSAPASIFDNGLLRWKLNYQFTRPLSLRAIIDYENVSPNTALVDLEREQRLGVDLLATCQLNPGTALYVGYADHRENLAVDGTVPLSVRRTDSLNLSTGRQFFVKLSYLIRR